MPNILYMAISRDGYIADIHDNTPWTVAEWDAFRGFVASCDVVILGKRTFQIMQDNDEFITGPKYVIATSSAMPTPANFSWRNIRTIADMPTGARVGIIGGGELNGRLAAMGAIDEIILDVEPVTLGAGIKLFGNYDIPLKLRLVESKKIGHGTIQRHYNVVN